MPFLQLTLSIGAADPGPFEEALFASGASSVTLEDAADDPVLEPAPGTTPLWHRVQLRALFAADADPHAIETALRAQVTNVPALQFATLEDRIWEREWLKDFRPMRFGRRLWICPAGLRPEAAAVAQADDAVFLDLDPGLAFGTGTHPTTSLCLQWLDSADLRGKRVIDFGCGSGVLAIAALRLGASQVTAVDIDPQALQATHENAIRNGVADRLLIAAPEALDDDPADALIANILAEPLQQLAPRFARLMRPRGTIVLSGILHTQAAAVASSYAPWFDMSPATVLDDWIRLEGVRSPGTPPR